MGNIARITRLPLREVWQHEALDFTTWLESNLDLLTEALGFELDSENVSREAGAGDFNVDLVAEDNNGRTVVIENQLTRSDHAHLGKLLTYLVMLEADVCVWITQDARPEHVKVISWLNDSTPVSAFLLQLEAVKIGGSDPAPLVTAIVSPSPEARQAASTKAEKTERHRLRRGFWEEVLALDADRRGLHSTISPGDGPYISTSAGYQGLAWVYGVQQHGTKVVLWIDTGAGDGEVEEQLFDQLRKRREEIEDKVGADLVWENKPKNRSCKLIRQLSDGGWRDVDEWQAVVLATVEAMEGLVDAVGPHLDDLQYPATPVQ